MPQSYQVKRLGARIEPRWGGVALIFTLCQIWQLMRWLTPVCGLSGILSRPALQRRYLKMRCIAGTFLCYVTKNIKSDGSNAGGIYILQGGVQRTPSRCIILWKSRCVVKYDGYIHACIFGLTNVPSLLRNFPIGVSKRHKSGSFFSPPFFSSFLLCPHNSYIFRLYTFAALVSSIWL